MSEIVSVLLVGVVLSMGAYVVFKEWKWKSLPQLENGDDFASLVKALERAGIEFDRKMLGTTQSNNVIDINDHRLVTLRVKLQDFEEAKRIFDRVVR